MSKKKIYGLTEEEAAALESEDEEYYCIDEEDPPHVSSVDSDLDSDYEEDASNGISTHSEVEDTINTFVNEQSSSDSGESNGSDGITCLESDPLYMNIERALSVGCSCLLSCLSQFDMCEVFLLHLSLSEMEKSEDMFLLGKLQAVSETQDDVRHARASPGKPKCVTCDYRFDGSRSVCKDGFLFLHDLGTKDLKNT